MVWRIARRTVVALVVAIIISVSLSLVYRAFRQHEVAASLEIHSPDAIYSLEAVPIGGIEQWVEVRGQDVNNPILLVLHGGPGVPFLPLAGAFQGPWEKHFTVVEWDQRGAGKTFASNSASLQERTMNLPQMEQDTLEVTRYLRSRFHRDKIFVMGHSWGSLLGLWLAHEHPELVYAYVGVGQVVNMRQNEAVAYHDALEQALDEHNERAVRALESLAPYPPAHPDLRKGMIAHQWQAALLGPPRGAASFEAVGRILGDVFTAPQYSLWDDSGFVRGQSASLKILVPQVATLDLTKLGLDFDTPVFFFEGRHDPYCPPSLIWTYSQSIKAPQKEFIWFENSGHFPFFDENQKFTEELVKQVLPLARANASRP
jgi:pimeloyl-ACP methyl ester carboxylesterase